MNDYLTNLTNATNASTTRGGGVIANMGIYNKTIDQIK